ncbi:MAG TPA: hypothetical protein VFU45_00245 [Gemmatimonadales bacterium]|nr:hypothetical protein [Gemmatimonadales bacterium]
MTHECTTTLPGAEVLARAVTFFAERVPQYAAFLDERGPAFVTLRGQGGEEVAIAVSAAGAATHVRASTLFFDQAVARFLNTLPAAEVVA